MKKYRILIIEDEKHYARVIELELLHENYEVITSHSGIDGLNAVKDYKPDLVLLDINLPGMDGIEVCRRIRLFSEVPVIMLTARDETIDKVMGLDSGANDYVTKPFIIEELLARMRAALRNGEQMDSSSKSLKLADLELDDLKHTVKRGSQFIDLTKREYDLLEYLLRNRDIVLTRGRIIENVWGFDFEGDTNVVDVYIRYLRSKIDDSSDVKLIHTVRGVGYIMTEDKKGD